MGYGPLGNISVLTVMLFLGIGALFVHRLIAQVYYRTRLVIAALVFVIYLGYGWLVTTCVNSNKTGICSTNGIYIGMITAAAINGVASALIWCTQAIYCAECSSSVDRGMIFGVFFSVFNGSQIIGNICTPWFLANFGENGMFAFATIVSIIAVVMFIFVQKPIQPNTTTEIVVILPTDHVGDHYTNLHETDVKASVTDDAGVKPLVTLTTIKNLITQDRFKVLIPLFCVAMINSAFILSFLSKLADETVEDLPKDERTTQIGYVLLALGVDNIASGQIFGRLMDKDKMLGVKAIYVWDLIMLTVAVIGRITLSYPVHILLGFLLGGGDGGGQTVIGAVISLKFMDTFNASAGFRFLSCLAGALFCLLFIFLQKPCLHRINDILGCGYMWCNCQSDVIFREIYYLIVLSNYIFFPSILWVSIVIELDLHKLSKSIASAVTQQDIF
jgi:hypothetical protein